MENLELYKKAEDAANNTGFTEEVINSLVEEIERLEKECNDKDDYITSLEEDIANFKADSK